jgi:WD40 repeat protein/energy-coupling factor transporter ATP-binding protein EcfA2
MTTDNIDLRGSQGAIIGASGPITQHYAGYSAEQVSALISQIKRVDQPSTWDGRRPYVGLAAFQERDAAFFFGREQLVEELLGRLQSAAFVCVAGPSGSGKSSLVQAGLIHALRQGALEGSDKWLIERMTPQGSPLEQLARSVSALALSAGKPSSVGDELRSRAPSDPLALHDLVDLLTRSAGAPRTLLYVDQFEELFTQTHSEQERSTFLTQLTGAVQVQAGALSVVISLRSDFLSQCATYPALRELISQQFQLVGALSAEELVRAITLPALEVGVQIEPELVAQLIADMKGEPGSLPLMQFALKDLFDAQQANKGDAVRLTLAEYLERGGVQQALERHANQVFGQFDAEQQQLVRIVFSRLIEVGRGTLDTRRIAAFSDLTPAGVDSKMVESLVKALADGRLVTTASGLQDQPTVTIAHEKLIDAWPWLRRLVDDNREAIALQNQVDEDANEWQRNQRDASYLYSGARLATVRERLAEEKITLGGLAQEYIDAALAEREARRLAEDAQRRQQLDQAQALAEEQRQRAEAQQQRAEAQTRSTRRLRVLAAGLLAVLIVALGAAVFAYSQSQTALARQLASQATALVENRVDSALLLAVEASKHQVGDMPDVRSGLLGATQCCSESLIAFLAGHEDRVWDVAFDPSGATLVSSGDDGSLHVWDVAARQEITRLVNPTSSAGIYTVAFSPDGKLLASGDGDGALTWRDAESWQMLGEPVKAHDFNIHAIEFSHDGQRLVSGSGDGRAIVWDVAARTPITTGLRHANWVWDVAISDDGATVASVGRDRTIHLWSLDQPVLLSNGALTTTLILTDHNRTLTSVAFNSDPVQPLMVTGDADGNAIIWDMTPWMTERKHPIPSEKFNIHTDIIWSLEFDRNRPDELISSSQSGVMRRWRVALAEPFAKSRLQAIKLGVTGHAFGVSRVALSPDGQMMAAAGLDNLVSLWHAVERDNIIWHTGAVRGMALVEDGVTLLSAGSDGVVQAWDTATRQMRSRVQLSPTVALANGVFSPDGSLLAAGNDANAVRLWDVRTGQSLAELAGHNAKIQALAFSPDGSWLASGDQAGEVIVWDMRTRQPSQRLTGHPGGVLSLAFHADSTLLAVGGCQTVISFPSIDCGRGAIYFWDATTGERVGEPLPGKSGYVVSLVFHPLDPDLLAVGSMDGTVSMWNVRSRAAGISFDNPGRINALAFSPDGALLAVATNSYRFSLYDAATGQVFGRFFKEHDAWVIGFAFSADGETLYSVANDRTVVLHDLRPEYWAERSCRFANRDLTEEEWERYLGDTRYQKTCADS